MTAQPAESPSALVDRFVAIALATAVFSGEDTAESVASWAAEVLPPTVMQAVGMGELLRRAVRLLGEQDEVTEEAPPGERRVQ